MQKMNLWSHDQATMAHQSKTGKRHPNGNITRKMRLGRTTGVTASRVPTPTQGQNYKAAIYGRNSLCLPLHKYQLCTPTEKPNIRRYFEAYRWKQGVIIRHHHAENRQLAENAFIYSVRVWVRFGSTGQHQLTHMKRNIYTQLWWWMCPLLKPKTVQALCHMGP